jgi:hypothetical protein
MTVDPPSLSPLELDVMRLALGLGLLWTLTSVRQLPFNPQLAYPIGLARVVDLRFLTRYRWLQDRAADVAMLAYVVDRGTTWALLFLSAYLVLRVTAGSSDGSVNHGDHLVVIVTVAQLAAVVVWNIADRWDLDLGGWLAATRGETAVWWSAQVIAAAYFTSGISKLVYSGGTWIQRSPGLLASARAHLDLIRVQPSMSRMRNVARAERLIDRLQANIGVARLLFASGLVVELAAPLGLLDENVLLVVGIGLLALHQSNRLLLGLPFSTYQILVLGFFVNVPRLVA